MIFTAMALAALMQPSHEWVVAFVQPGEVTAIDRSTVRHQSNRTVFWTINVKRDPDARGGRYFIARKEVNCTSPDAVKTTNITAYRDDDQPIVSFDPGTTTAVLPGTLMDHMVGMVCRNEWPGEGIKAAPGDFADMSARQLRR